MPATRCIPRWPSYFNGGPDNMRDPSKLSGSEWTPDDLIAIEHMCSRHAANYALDTFPNQMEVITSEQMLDSYISAGLPVNYAHWSFGKHYLIENAKYRR